MIFTEMKYRILDEGGNTITTGVPSGAAFKKNLDEMISWTRGFLDGYDAKEAIITACGNDCTLIISVTIDSYEILNDTLLSEDQ